MSIELVIALIVLGLAGLVGLFYISHSIEKQRRQKALLVASLNDQCFRLQRLMDFIPPAYVSKDIRQVLLKQIKMRLDRLLELAPDNEKFAKKMDSCTAQLTELQTTGAPPQPPILKTAEEANELRTLLQELSKLIESLAHSKVIPVGDANKYLQSIQASFIDASLNYFLQMGNNARQQKKPKLAIHHFQKAIAEMQKRNQQGIYAEKLEQLKQLIAELQVEAGAEPAPVAVDAPNELDQGLNELMQEQEAWKKKYF